MGAVAAREQQTAVGLGHPARRLCSFFRLSARLRVLCPGPGETYTEFYLLGPSGMMQGYPTNFTLGNEQSVIVGITNHEDRDVNYTLVARLNDSQTSDTLYTGTVAVANGENVQKTIALTPNRTGNDTRIDFLLYRDNDLTTPYRET